MQPIILSGLLQGFGLGCTFVPLNTIALSDLPRHILTQGTALRSLMRNLGGSIGIPILEARLAENTQIVHSRLVEHLRLGNPLARAPYLAALFNLTAAAGIAALNAEVTRQAAMVAYINDFRADDDRHDRPNRAVAVGVLAAPLVRRLPAPSLRGLRGPAARGKFEPSNSGLPAVISKWLVSLISMLIITNG
jgi:hypothetical protein